MRQGRTGCVLSRRQAHVQTLAGAPGRLNRSGPLRDAQPGQPEPEVLPVEAGEASETAVSFAAESFSVYGVIYYYTVAAHDS